MVVRICELCNQLPAVRVCQRCGSLACSDCYTGSMCKKCNGKLDTHNSPEVGFSTRTRFLFPAAVLLILVGVVLVLLGSTTGASGVEGCVFWPFPLIISCSTGSNTIPLLAFGILAAGFLTLQAILWYRALCGSRGESPEKETFPSSK